MLTILAMERCSHCKLLGHDALRGEIMVGTKLRGLQVWRHAACGHVLMWRAGGLLREIAREVDSVGRLRGDVSRLDYKRVSL